MKLRKGRQNWIMVPKLQARKTKGDLYPSMASRNMYFLLLPIQTSQSKRRHFSQSPTIHGGERITLKRDIIESLPSLFSCIDCMGKVWIEVCIVSARGLRHSSSLWKLQWYAVAWIDPCNKYCTKLDASANGNPAWRMKFASSVDESNSSFDDLALNVQVYSREPVFLTETLRGTATIVLKEFVAKHNKSSENSSAGTGEVGSYQLRKRNSTKPQGFIDLSVHISAERAEPYSYPLADRSDTVTLSTDDGSIPIQADRPPSLQEAPFPANFLKPSASGPSYRPPATPSSTLSTPNVGNLPTIFPRRENLQNSASINMPPSRPGVSPKTGPGFGMGVGAGALAAGAFIFGDDFIAGFDAPMGNMSNASLSRTTDPSI